MYRALKSHTWISQSRVPSPVALAQASEGHWRRISLQNKVRPTFQYNVPSHTQISTFEWWLCLRPSPHELTNNQAIQNADAIQWLYASRSHLSAASSLDNTLAKRSRVTSCYPCKLPQLVIRRCPPLLWGPQYPPLSLRLLRIGAAEREKSDCRLLFFSPFMAVFSHRNRTAYTHTADSF